MGRHAIFFTMIALWLLIYSVMGCISVASSAVTTGGYYHYYPIPHVAIIPVIRLYTQWWNPSRTFSILPVDTQISLPYSSTNQSTALYIIPRDWIITSVFANTLAIIPHRLFNFFRFSTPPTNLYCCRRMYVQGQGRTPTVTGPLHWSGTRPYLHQSRSVGSCGGVSSPLPVSFLWHIVPGVHPPWWDLATTLIALREGFGVFL